VIPKPARCCCVKLSHWPLMWQSAIAHTKTTQSNDNNNLGVLVVVVVVVVVVVAMRD
jgi:hypothetical protein